jgi:hypothetical protein
MLSANPWMTGNCKMQIAKCKLQIGNRAAVGGQPTADFVFPVNCQFAICNLQFAISRS